MFFEWIRDSEPVILPGVSESCVGRSGDACTNRKLTTDEINRLKVKVVSELLSGSGDSRSSIHLTRTGW